MMFKSRYLLLLLSEIDVLIRIELMILSIVKKKEKINLKILTYDLETKNIIINNKNLIIPQLACFFDGKVFNTFYVNNYNNHNEIIIDSLNKMFISKYNNHTVYINNLSKFDGVFLLKNIIKIVGNENIVMTDRDGAIINLLVKYGDKNQYKIKSSLEGFKRRGDSYPILSISV